MNFPNNFKTLYNEIEKLMKRDMHNIVEEAKFLKLKTEIMDMLKALIGETSRAYRVVKLTNSPATVFKVMSHVANKTEAVGTHIAVNM